MYHRQKGIILNILKNSYNKAGDVTKTQENNKLKGQANNSLKRYTMILSHTKLFQYFSE